jgi:hypothetical protein
MPNGDELATAPRPGQESLDHAWDWFKYHAEQRMMMLRFAITVIGGVGAGIGFFLKDGTYIFSLLLSVFGGVVAFTAIKLDRRTSDLGKH